MKKTEPMTSEVTWLAVIGGYPTNTCLPHSCQQSERPLCHEGNLPDFDFARLCFLGGRLSLALATSFFQYKSHQPPNPQTADHLTAAFLFHYRQALQPVLPDRISGYSAIIVDRHHDRLTRHEI